MHFFPGKFFFFGQIDPFRPLEPPPAYLIFGKAHTLRHSPKSRYKADISCIGQ